MPRRLLRPLRLAQQIGDPNAAKRVRRAFNQQAAGQRVTGKRGAGGADGGFVVLPQHVERSNQPRRFRLAVRPSAERQVESAEPKMRQVIFVREAVGDALRVNFHA